MKMPFGKHKGTAVAELPESYLRWLQEKVELRDPLKTAVVRVLAGESPEPPTDEEKLERLFNPQNDATRKA